MRKIVQISYDYSEKRRNSVWLALCDDGTVWRQLLVQDTLHFNPSTLQIVDPTFHTEWERVTEFDLIPNGDNKAQL